jgi:hypothetical protein
MDNRARGTHALEEKRNLAYYPLDNCLDLFDEQFTLSNFRCAIEKAGHHSDDVVSSARLVVAKAFSNDPEEYRYVVDMTGDTKEALEAGKIKLVENSDGEIFAQLRNANGRYGKRLPIKKELIEEGISVEALMLAIQMEAIKDQLQAMIETLKEIEGRITEVAQGQRNDRIGLFYSGLSLYVEAREIKDEYLRKQLTAQALKSLSDANSQMIQDIRTNVDYLVNKQYARSKKGVAGIDERISIIRQCYDVVYRASFLKAAIYQENGEIASMLTAIDEYGRFVEKIILPNVGNLSELDKDSRFIEAGTWGTIAHTLEGCRELKQRISGGNIYYLDKRGTENAV